MQNYISGQPTHRAHPPGSLLVVKGMASGSCFMMVSSPNPALPLWLSLGEAWSGALLDPVPTLHLLSSPSHARRLAHQTLPPTETLKTNGVFRLRLFRVLLLWPSYFSSSLDQAAFYFLGLRLAGIIEIQSSFLLTQVSFLLWAFIFYFNFCKNKHL